MDKVTVIIPTYNRFKYVLNTIKSVNEQTHKNVEIIVVNDCSTEKEYYEYDWKNKIIHLEENTKKKFGYACAGYVRNKGIEIATGKYIAFCDDDDIWFPNKLELQLKAMNKTGCKMSSTDGLMGGGVYNPAKLYPAFNAQQCYNYIQHMFRMNNSTLFDNGFPEIWTLDFLKVNNSMICSSVIVEKEILDKINNFRCVKNGEEDYGCWLQALEHTNSVYVPEMCFYYDTGHGDGQNY